MLCRSVEAIWNGVKGIKCFDGLNLCSDDRESDDLLYVGQMNAVVRKAIQVGMDPILAIKSATINTAREIGMKNLGAIAPGYVADLVLLDSLEEMVADTVFFEGNMVATKGALTVEITSDKSYDIESRNSMKLSPMQAEAFMIDCPIQKDRKSVV